ncbi:MAG TPA: DUF998 domain-containing protein [Stenotrophomonas sp.]|jgi:hypothetical protein
MPVAVPTWAKRTAVAAAVAGVAFVVLVVVLQCLRGDLPWMQAQLSLYLRGPYGLLLRTAYCLLALVIAALAGAVQASLAPGYRSGATLALFWGASLGLATVAIGDSWLPDQTPLLAPLVHLLAAQAAFICVVAAILLQSWRFRGEPRWHRLHRPA